MTTSRAARRTRPHGLLVHVAVAAVVLLGLAPAETLTPSLAQWTAPVRTVTDSWADSLTAPVAEFRRALERAQGF